jgi:hypothetical protein
VLIGIFQVAVGSVDTTTARAASNIDMIRNFMIILGLLDALDDFRDEIEEQI